MSEPTPERPKRLTLSHVVEMLLSRGSGDRSTVTLARNAKGDVQIDVTVRTGDHDEIATVDDAARKAREVFEQLRAKYPTSDGHDNASIEFTRNAKGETQITVELKTSEGGAVTLEEAAERALDVYDSTRAKYPMADGYTAKPGSVK